ncbi:MAG: hypothetical protein IKP74_05175, partial [Clostridia bacterium]|nr:hypothetical protein [Clostridia bacterium]
MIENEQNERVEEGKQKKPKKAKLKTRDVIILSIAFLILLFFIALPIIGIITTAIDTSTPKGDTFTYKGGSKKYSTRHDGYTHLVVKK